MEELVVHAFDYQIKDEYDDNGKMVIHAWCMDRESNPNLIRIHNFPVFCFVELPTFVNGKMMFWGDGKNLKTNKIFDAIRFRLDKSGDAPFDYQMRKSQKLYYYRYQKQYSMMMLRFHTRKAMTHCQHILQKPIHIKDVGLVYLRMWETHIPIERKMLSAVGLAHCQWFRVNATLVEPENKVSKLQKEYTIEWIDIKPIPVEETSTWSTSPSILAFDIETYSDKYNKFPNPLSALHKVFNISCIYQKGNVRKKYIIVFGDSNTIPGVTIIKVNNEIELVDKFASLINEIDPDILVGYNIFGFDYPYLNTRLSRMGRDWTNCTRLLYDKVKIHECKWASSGAGHNNMEITEMDGRISIDLFPLIKRDYKLDKYTLDFVSHEFLGRGKHDVKPIDMFISFETLQNYYNQLVSALLLLGFDESTLRFDTINIDTIYNTVKDTASKELFDIINKYKDATDKMTKVMDYCVEDATLCLDIFAKINCWIALIEMSNVVGVTPVQIFTRGQQIRTLSQIYNVSFSKNIIIDERIIPKSKYSGGLVQPPIPGMYSLIPCLDFNSLYPTVMIAHNICYTTLIPPELMDQIPDTDCHVIEWEELQIPEKNKEEEEDGGLEQKEGKVVHFKYKFIKEPQGIIPGLLVNLIQARNHVKKLEKVEKDPVVKTVLDCRQKALKISANSIYGGLGVEKGRLPLPEGAAAVTAKSRESITRVNKYIENKGHAIVYGDSVTSDTPILCQKQDKLFYILISELCIDKVWIKKHGKEYCSDLDGLKVWSDLGFTDIKHVMKHKTNKKIYKITTDNGYVKVTEDHSLLDIYCNVIQPKHLKVGDFLLTCPLPPFNDTYIVNSCREAEDYFINKREKKRGIVLEIKEEILADDYVYDLETANHHFGAGVGEIVVHNTDSSMPDFGFKNPMTAYEESKAWAEELTELFPKPMVLEEEEVYYKLLCITKKKYAAIKMDKMGKPVMDVEKMKIRGILLARRDNCKWQRRVFKTVLWNIMTGISMLETCNYILEECLKLHTRQVSVADLIVIKGLGANYTNESFPMKIFGDELAKIGKPAQAGERLEYIVVKTLEEQQYVGRGKLKVKMGYKMRSPDTYEERLGTDMGEPIDVFYYINNCLKKPIEQLFGVGYKKELQELEKLYLDNDYRKVFNELSIMGYDKLILNLHLKYRGNKEYMLDWLSKSTIASKVKPLVTKYITKKTGTSRITSLPITNFIKFTELKQKVCTQLLKTVPIL